jgi:hypothetical protein
VRTPGLLVELLRRHWSASLTDLAWTLDTLLPRVLSHQHLFTIPRTPSRGSFDRGRSPRVRVAQLSHRAQHCIGVE